MSKHSPNKRRSPKEIKKVLVLGGAGFLGSNLVRYCLAKGAKVVVVDSLHPLFKSVKTNLKNVIDEITFIKGDIRDADLLKKVIPGQDIIFNCAAQTSHPISLQDAILDTEINCLGNLRVLSAVKDYNPEAVILYTSSSTVVGKAIHDIIDEHHGEKPLEIYSANKGVAEKYYRIYNNLYGLKTIVLRFANLYGPFGKNYPEFGFVNYFINQSARGKTIQIYGEGNQSRNLMFVDDASDIMWRAVEEPKLIGESYFAAHHEHFNVRQIAEIVAKTFKSKPPKLIPWPEMRKKIEVDNVLISSARLHYLTGWRPKYSLAEGLKLTKKRMLSKSY